LYKYCHRLRGGTKSTLFAQKRVDDNTFTKRSGLCHNKKSESNDKLQQHCVSHCCSCLLRTTQILMTKRRNHLHLRSLAAVTWQKPSRTSMPSCTWRRGCHFVLTMTNGPSSIKCACWLSNFCNISIVSKRTGYYGRPRT
jgi:hypothetical protein